MVTLRTQLVLLPMKSLSPELASLDLSEIPLPDLSETPLMPTTMSGKCKNRSLLVIFVMLVPTCMIQKI